MRMAVHLTPHAMEMYQILHLMLYRNLTPYTMGTDAIDLRLHLGRQHMAVDLTL